ncbi:hypothetical protein DID88_008369 [Monilinia fructigena]|uniref:Uncharacterized protein n=1 Tax=Monilinia fructigena TaxID=38457 RepID=A0A395J567_9HELO|nr:hypothetical protein DID88_008369 [Monilinia fructigena]
MIGCGSGFVGFCITISAGWWDRMHGENDDGRFEGWQKRNHSNEALIRRIMVYGLWSMVYGLWFMAYD